MFYDAAGENFNDLTKLIDNKIRNYLGKADGIMYLIDPLQMPYITDRLSLAEVPDDNIDDIDNLYLNVIGRINDCIRTTKDQRNNNQKLNAKMAVVLTKFDVLMGNPTNADEEEIMFDQNSPILSTPRIPMTVDQDNIDQISGELEEFIGRATYGLLTNAVNLHYKDYRYFAASALGANPDGLHLKNRPNPFRIEDALIWLLSATGTHILDG